MTDYPEEIHAAECLERDMRTWCVTYRVTATVECVIDAPLGLTDEELMELADAKARVDNIVDWDPVEPICAEVI